MQRAEASVAVLLGDGDCIEAIGQDSEGPHRLWQET